MIGSAERGVREVKEAIAVVRLELAKHQLDIVDSLVGWDGTWMPTLFAKWLARLVNG